MPPATILICQSHVEMTVSEQCRICLYSWILLNGWIRNSFFRNSRQRLLKHSIFWHNKLFPPHEIAWHQAVSKFSHVMPPHKWQANLYLNPWSARALLCCFISLPTSSFCHYLWANLSASLQIAKILLKHTKNAFLLILSIVGIKKSRKIFHLLKSISVREQIAHVLASIAWHAVPRLGTNHPFRGWEGFVWYIFEITTPRESNDNSIFFVILFKL